VVAVRGVPAMPLASCTALQLSLRVWSRSAWSPQPQLLPLQRFSSLEFKPPPWLQHNAPRLGRADAQAQHSQTVAKPSSA
jgi:hypothetical protein